jgi:hypothetical protein
VQFADSPRCWVSIVNSPEDLGKLIKLDPKHIMRAISQIITQPIGEQKWMIDRAQASTSQIKKRLLFGPDSGPQAAKYNPRDQLSVTASHPRDAYPSRFHMPKEEPMFDVRVHFIHVVRGFEVTKGAGCPQYQKKTPGIIKIIPIIEITDKPGENALFRKEREAWFEVSESEIATYEVITEKHGNNSMHANSMFRDSRLLSGTTT